MAGREQAGAGTPGAAEQVRHVGAVATAHDVTDLRALAERAELVARHGGPGAGSPASPGAASAEALRVLAARLEYAITVAMAHPSCGRLPSGRTRS